MTSKGTQTFSFIVLGGEGNTAFKLDSSGSVAFERELLIPSAQGNATKEKTKVNAEQCIDENE